ncbi:MAG TPA: chromosomal replication initiator protein DnaA [Coriobacteriia bacterium]
MTDGLKHPRWAAASPGDQHDGARTDDQLTLIWDEAKKHLRGRLSESAFQFWFDRTLPLGLDDGAFVIGVPNDFAREWIEKRLAGQVAEALGEVLGDKIDVRVVVDERAAELPQQSATADLPTDVVEPARPAGSPPKPRRASGARGARAAKAASDLNPRYVFDRFVTGPHNEYAAAVARSVAESPATAYNPVFMYADTGLGKTHLIQAIAHAALEQHPDLQIKYVTVERFTDDFINAVTDKNRIDGFKQSYRENDVLLIDDVQFLVEKQQTQVEFFHTFNALYEAGKQIVITSDRPPRELEELEESLRTRFGQGVVVDISRPDLETRIAILRKQVKWEGFQIAEPEVLEWIASRVTTNIRELYGALTRAVSYASIRGSEVTLDVTREALKDILPKAYQHPLTIELVQAEVARQFGLHVNDLRGNRRTQDVAYARHIAMYLSRNLTEASLPQIGARFGGRHHTTVIHGVDKVERQLKDGHDPQLQDLVALITARLKTVH